MQTQMKTTVKLSQLNEIPKCATITSNLDVTRFEKIARTSPKDIPAIRVGKIGNKLYPVSQQYVVKACKNVGVAEIHAYIEEYNTKYDLFADHVRLHSVDEPINPLAIRSMVDEFGLCNMDSSTALKELFLKDTGYVKIITSKISENAINELQKLVDQMSSRLSARNLVCPIYIILQVGKLEESLQLQGINEIKGVVLLEADHRFIWPTPDQVDMILSNIKPSSRCSPAQLADLSESVADTQDNMHKKNTDDKKNTAKSKPRSKPNTDTKTLLKQAKDIVIIANEKDGSPDYIMNTKSNAVQKIKKTDDGKSFALYGDLGKKAFTIPNDVVKHHNVQHNVLHHKNFTTIPSVESQLKKLGGKSGLKLTLFWSTE